MDKVGEIKSIIIFVLCCVILGLLTIIKTEFLETTERLEPIKITITKTENSADTTYIYKIR